MKREETVVVYGLTKPVVEKRENVNREEGNRESPSADFE